MLRLRPRPQAGFSALTLAINRARELAFARTYLAFGKARLTHSLDDGHLTHVVVSKNDISRLSRIRSTLSMFSFLHRRLTGQALFQITSSCNYVLGFRLC